ncbi:MAG: RidA family protein [Hyphomicrobiaceae bacterium]
MSRRLISSGSPFETTMGYSRAVVIDGWVMVSGTTGFNYETMSISDDVAEQVEQAFRNIAKALAEAGANLSDVVCVRYIFPSADDFEPCLPVMGRHFGDVRPAATLIVAGLVDTRMKVEIEVTARLPGVTA